GDCGEGLGNWEFSAIARRYNAAMRVLPLVYLIVAALPLTPQPAEHPPSPPVAKKQGAEGAQGIEASQAEQGGPSELTVKEAIKPKPEKDPGNSEATQELEINRRLVIFTAALVCGCPSIYRPDRPSCDFSPHTGGESPID